MSSFFTSRIRRAFKFSFLSIFALGFYQANAQTCTLPSNAGQCSGGDGQIAVAGATINNNKEFWSTINRTVTGGVTLSGSGRLTVCSGVLTLNNFDASGGILVVLQGQH